MTDEEEWFSKEETFTADCCLCGAKDVPCRNHHLIPQRLLNILPISRRKRFKFQVIKACNRCNRVLHPENKLYERINVLVKEIKKLKGNHG